MPAGLSPRVRGAGILWTARVNEGRIIPARAGSSMSLRKRSQIEKDHPRACGEQYGHEVTARPNKGSSPRVRGAGFRNRQFWITLRIIPARAGSRMLFDWKRAGTEDHPRACGEQGRRRMSDWSNRGSSPRVRGAVSCTASSAGALGIIPARAGSRWRAHGTR